MKINPRLALHSVSPSVSGGISAKTLLILFAVFAALGIAASYPWWARYFDFGEKYSSPAELDFSVFTKDATSRISIVKMGEKEKIFTSENGRWLVNGFDASEKEIDGFFSELAALKIESLASKNPDNHKNFEVTEEDGTVLTLFHGDDAVSFVFGKRGPAFNSVYAKIMDSSNVFLLSGLLSNKLAQDITAWRDKVIVDIQKDDIQKIEIISKKKPLVIEKQENEWKAEGLGKQATLDEAAVNRLLAALNPLEASGFLDEREQKEFEAGKEKTAVIVWGSSSEALAEIDLMEQSAEWWAALKGESVSYKIPLYQMSDIILKHEEIFK